MGLRTGTLVTGLLLLAACGGRSADFAVHETSVVVSTDAAFARAADFPARVEDTLQAALVYWGGTWKDLEGRTITFSGAPHVTCGDSTRAVGCYDGDIRVSTLDAGVSFDCVEETALVHEVGHAVIGDPAHADPRWLDFQSVANALAGRPGYRSGDEVSCAIYVSVWRHAPDAGAAD